VAITRTNQDILQAYFKKRLEKAGGGIGGGVKGKMREKKGGRG
jgi:hypothetical protein